MIPPTTRSSVNSISLGKWLPYYFASLRRQASAKRYQYKSNVPNIRQLKLQDAGKRLKNSQDQPAIPVFLKNDIFDNSLANIRKLLFEDVRRSNENVRFGLDVMNKTGKLKDWQIISSIFQTPVDPNLLDGDTFHAMATDKPLEIRHTIKLAALNDENGIDPFKNVLWPKLIFSYYCRGIGVTPTLYDKIANTGICAKKPLSDMQLPIFKVDFIPNGYDCIGLFPKFQKKHLEVFQEFDKFSALIESRLCDVHEINKIKKLVNADIGPETSSINFVDSDGKVSTNKREGSTLSDLVKTANFDSKLWSFASSKDRSCPGDILRSAIIANNPNRSAIRRDFLKHFVLFNTVSLTERLGQHLNTEGQIAEDIIQLWKPWDYAMWYTFQQYISATPKIKEINDLKTLRAHFSRFLEALTQYSTLVTSEMKLTGSKFFTGDRENSLSRADMVFLLLSTILRNNKDIDLLYPAMSTFISKTIHDVGDGRSNLLPKFGDEENYVIGITLLKIVKELIKCESHVYKDNFTSYKNMVSELGSSIGDWKVIVVYKGHLNEEYAKTIQYTTRIFTQFVNSLDDVDKVSYSKCVSKEMVNEDTFVYLYKMSRQPKSSTNDVLSEILKQHID